MKRNAPTFTIVSSDAVLQEVRTRMPFRYGKACLTAAPILLVKVDIETGTGTRATGYAGDCLPPLWFDKDPSKDFQRNVEDQIEAFRKARAIYSLLGHSAQPAHALWEAALPRVIDEAATTGINALTASFASSFFERAIADALCRAEGISFFDGLRRNLLGFDTAQHLPEKPRERIWCRHTVGLADPITRGEIADEDRLNDGLPQALEEDIEFYGLRYFKVKVFGEFDRDLERLTRMAALLSQRCENGYSVTLDGNEQYRSAGELERLLEELRSQPYGDELFRSILFVEQPLERSVALREEAKSEIGRLAELRPVLIDESDDRIDSFRRAVDLGYQGVSHKNCKGIFKSLTNRALISELNAELDEPRYFQSAEDLANVAVLPLHEDFAALAALDIAHAERNGHHYYRGLDHLPAAESEAALAAHSDLYTDSGDSVLLRIVDGTIDLRSVVSAVGFGYDCEIAFDERTQLDDWSFARLSASS